MYFIFSLCHSSSYPLNTNLYLNMGFMYMIVKLNENSYRTNVRTTLILWGQNVIRVGTTMFIKCYPSRYHNAN